MSDDLPVNGVATGTYLYSITNPDIAAAKKYNVATATGSFTDDAGNTETDTETDDYLQFLPQQNQRNISINDIFGSNINDPTDTTYAKQNSLFVSGAPTRNAIKGGFAITNESISRNQLDGYLVQLQGSDVDMLHAC